MIGLVAVNCRYSHTNPAVRILRNIALNLGLPAWIEEFTLGDPAWKIAERILARNPKIVGLSVYLWNRARMLELARILKASLPGCWIVAGGPEISFEASLPPGIDQIIPDEAEAGWQNLLRERLGARVAGKAPPPCAPQPVWPYRTEDYPELRGRLVYLETSRGCPFRCAFCLSSTGERWRPWEALSREETLAKIRELVAAGVTTFKFLDRSFNADPARALDWFHALSSVEDAAFHFEIRADLLDEETFAFLTRLRPGQFQFEVGVQSLLPQALQAIGRSPNMDKMLGALQRLAGLRTVHVHADLIWGLPEETFDTAKAGLNRLYAIGLDEIQLGFLKFLPGTPLLNLSEKYGYQAQTVPPYEVVCSQTLSATDLIRLHQIEHVFNLFSNSKRFVRSLERVLVASNKTPFELFETVARHFSDRDLFRRSLSLDDQYAIFRSIFRDTPDLDDLLRLDYVTAQAIKTMPQFLRPDPRSPAGLRLAEFQSTHRSRTDSDFIFIALNHELAPDQRSVLPDAPPALYRVQHHLSHGYLHRVTVQKV